MTCCRGSFENHRPTQDFSIVGLRQSLHKDNVVGCTSSSIYQTWHSGNKTLALTCYYYNNIVREMYVSLVEQMV